MKVSYSRRGGLFRLRTGRSATSRTPFLAWEGVAGKPQSSAPSDDWERCGGSRTQTDRALVANRLPANLLPPFELRTQRHRAVSLRSAEQCPAVRRFLFVIFGF